MLRSILIGLDGSEDGNAAVDARRIRVETKGGHVTLRGNVQTWVEREEAERSAWAAQGVTSVQNLIGPDAGPGLIRSGESYARGTAGMAHSSATRRLDEGENDEGVRDEGDRRGRLHREAYPRTRPE